MARTASLARSEVKACFAVLVDHEAAPGMQPPHDVLLAQYQVVAARRQNFDVLVWQVPALGLTAQAFLMTIALGPGAGHLARIATGLLSALAALMSVHLLLRHRMHEVADNRWLRAFERSQGWELVHQRPADRVAAQGVKASGLRKFGSHEVWIAGLSIFGAVGLAAAIAAL